MSTTMSSPSTPPPPPPPGPPPGRPTGRRLVRSRDDRMLGGVAGGIAQTYGFDPALVRIVVAAAMVFTLGTGFAAYVIAWIVIPEDDGRAIVDDFRSRSPRRHRHSARRTPWLGIALVIAGLFALGDAWHPGPARVLGPLALLAAGAAILLYRHDHEPPTAGDPVSHSGPDAAADVAADLDESNIDHDVDGSAGATPTVTQSAYETHPWPTAPTPPVAPAPRRPPRDRSILGRVTFSALLLLVGVAWVVDLSGAMQVNPGFVLALALGVVGGALVAGAWFGRALHLIGLGIVLTVICSIVAAISIPLRGGIGEHVYRPIVASDVRTRYDLAIGHLVVDLSQVPAGSIGRRLVVRDGMGRAEITVPPDADVTVHARVDAGNLDLFGQPSNGGWHVRDEVHLAGSGPHIDIDARVGFGEVTVRRAAGNLSSVPAPEVAP